MIANNIMGEENIVGWAWSDEDDKEYLRSIPEGYRFRPTDHELVLLYLKRVIDKQPLPRNNIRRIDIYNHSPQQLCQRDEEQREEEWYFISPRDRKYRNGNRPRRQAVGGFWKATGMDRPVFFKERVVGYKMCLDFYSGEYQKNPTRTDWKMHEYRIHRHPQPVVTNTQNTATAPNNMTLDVVLCKIYRKTNAKKKDNNEDDIDDTGVHQPANDHQNTPHFNNEQQQPPPQQLQTVVEPYNSYGGGFLQSFFMDTPTSSTTTDSFLIHDNGGQEDGNLQYSVQGAGEDYYYNPPFGPVRPYNGFDELSSMFNGVGRRPDGYADKNA